MTSHHVTLVPADGARTAPKGVFEARHLIDGTFVDSADGRTFTRHSPASGEVRMGGTAIIANDATYGLSAGVGSDNVHTCLEFVRRVHAGTVWTNSWMDGYAELPFGGVKESGLGRELGRFGIEEYLEVKTVQMRIGKTRAMWV